MSDWNLYFCAFRTNMNYLAHLHLSANSEPIMLGNFIADAVKGKQLLRFSPGIQQGILIHRAIDSFTDKHELVREGKSRLYPVLGKFAGVGIDLFYDFFLSVYWTRYSMVEKQEFIRHAYRLLVANYPVMPPKMQHLLPFFVVSNWLGKYGTFSGLRQVLRGMGRHTALPAGGDRAVEGLETYYVQYEQEFLDFFPLLKDYLTKSFSLDF